MEQLFRGKTAVVTAASSVIGDREGSARRFAAERVDTELSGRRRTGSTAQPPDSPPTTLSR
jgi:hypothetical protein